jgi:hypothetical protein
MTTGFLEGHQANGAFVACGPPGFTALAMIKLGQASLVILPEFDLISPQAGEVRSSSFTFPSPSFLRSIRSVCVWVRFWFRSFTLSVSWEQ